MTHGQISIGFFIIGVIGLHILGVELNGQGIIAFLEFLVSLVFEGCWILAHIINLAHPG